MNPVAARAFGSDSMADVGTRCDAVDPVRVIDWPRENASTDACAQPALYLAELGNGRNPTRTVGWAAFCPTHAQRERTAAMLISLRTHPASTPTPTTSTPHPHTPRHTPQATTTDGRRHRRGRPAGRRPVEDAKAEHDDGADG